MTSVGAVAVWALLACHGAAPAGRAATSAARRLVPRVHTVLPHDTGAFTQGLTWNGGVLFESTGLAGRSSLRAIDAKSGRIVRRVELPDRLFGEGLALVGDRLVQLTWQDEVALVWQAQSFAPLARLAYRGEGWGLTYDGRDLIMSDGTETLVRRDPSTFAERGRIRVVDGGAAVSALNELEWVDGTIWANLWMTEEIVGIDAASGEVVARVDASGLLDSDEAARADVLNGIAWDPQAKVFFITGKLWPKLFVVTFEPLAARPTQSQR